MDLELVRENTIQSIAMSKIQEVQILHCPDEETKAIFSCTSFGKNQELKIIQWVSGAPHPKMRGADHISWLCWETGKPCKCLVWFPLSATWKKTENSNRCWGYLGERMPVLENVPDLHMPSPHIIGENNEALSPQWRERQQKLGGSSRICWTWRLVPDSWENKSKVERLWLA